MATITLTWDKAASGGTPATYSIYRKQGNHVEADVLSGPDAGYPVVVNHNGSTGQTFTDDGDVTNDSNHVSGTPSAPLSGTDYSYTVTATNAGGTSNPADNASNAIIITA